MVVVVVAVVVVVVVFAAIAINFFLKAFTQTRAVPIKTFTLV